MELSIILPTYNNEKTLRECLDSLTEQSFPKNEYEILVIDGGSTDKTRDIAAKYPVKIVHNPHRIEEKARIQGIALAKGRVIAFIDADNVVEGEDWIKKMMTPFKDHNIAFADTLYFSYRSKDPLKVAYQALIGGDDPLATYLGLYSRWCYFTNDWTGFPYKKELKRGYWKIQLTNKQLVPAMGSNGFFVRTALLRKFVKNSFIHSDFVYDLINKGHNCFAKVDIGIVHNQPTFFKNKIRRIQRRLYNRVHIRYNYGLSSKKIAYIFLRSLLVLPVFYDIIRGYLKKPNVAWLFHIPALYGLIAIHVYYRLCGRFLKA